MTDPPPPAVEPAVPPAPAVATTSTQSILGPWQAVTVLIVLLALLAALLLSVARFDESEDVVAILGVLVTPIVSIGAAAFGVTIAADKAAQAGAAAGNASASAATAGKDRANRQKAAGAAKVESARQILDPILAHLERIGTSPAGSRTLELQYTDSQGTAAAEHIQLGQLGDAREQLAAAAELLRQET